MNIVLVHGILGFREKFGIEYFRNVAEHFREKGFKVIAPVLEIRRKASIVAAANFVIRLMPH